MASPERLAIITGASRGIGAATARALGHIGCKVALLARSIDQTEALAAQIRGEGGSAWAFQCDVSKADEIHAVLPKVLGLGSAPTVLINNAGVGGPFKTLEETSDEEYDLIFNTNVRSSFLLSRSLLPYMRAERFGRIVNISSVLGLTGASGSSTYIATKHALVGYTKAIAAESGQYGITCNAICPGFINTGMGLSPDAVPDHSTFVRTRIPSRRVGEPAEVANLIAFLCSEQAGYVNGAILAIDGGLLADLSQPGAAYGH